MTDIAKILIIGLVFSVLPAVVLAAPPIATIFSLVDGVVMTKSESVRFEGSGSDVEDGILSGKSLVWTSDREGLIGTGESFGTKLSSGSHIITLTVIDIDGEMGTTQVTVIVEE